MTRQRYTWPYVSSSFSVYCLVFVYFPLQLNSIQRIWPFVNADWLIDMQAVHDDPEVMLKHHGEHPEILCPDHGRLKVEPAVGTAPEHVHEE